MNQPVALKRSKLHANSEKKLWYEIGGEIVWINFDRFKHWFLAGKKLPENIFQGIIRRLVDFYLKQNPYFQNKNN